MIDSISEMADADANLKRARRQRGDTKAPSLDRLPPHDTSSEQGTIGCALLDPPFALDLLLNKFSKCGKGVFYDLRHQIIYEVLADMRNKLEPIDLITVQARLKDIQMLEQIGGIAYLSNLQDCVPSAANVEYYAEIVFEKYILRCYIQTCSGIVGQIYEHEGDVSALAGEIEKQILKINAIQTPEFILPTPSQLANKVVDSIQKAWESDGPSGLSTGFADLDAATDGLHGGKVYVIAARPSMGKSSLAGNIAEHVTINLGHAVGVFSLEMPAASWIERMLASVSKVNIRAMKKDKLMAETDVPKIMNAVGKVSAAKLFIDDTSGLSILQLRARARRMAKEAEEKGTPIKLWIIDYLQLLNSTKGSSRDNREREVADISEGAKGMAKELNVPVIILSQLNRESEKAGSGKPKMSQLRESGAIEQDADLVGLLYRTDDNDDPSTQGEQDLGFGVTFFIAKQRDGEANIPIHLTFLKPYTRFESAAKFTGPDVPAYTPPENYQAHFPDDQ